MGVGQLACEFASIPLEVALFSCKRTSPMASDASNFDSLGSLAQSARTQQLKGARTILFIVGALTVAVNLFLVINAESMVQKEIDKEIEKVRRQGMEIDQSAVREVRESSVASLRLLNGIAVALGVVFIVFGFLVYQYPVPITITSLILYIGAMAVYGFLDPTTLAQGIIMKVIVIGALAKAIKAALAYQKEEESKSATSGFASDTFSPPSPEF
jgi:hypothetical protein